MVWNRYGGYGRDSFDYPARGSKLLCRQRDRTRRSDFYYFPGNRVVGLELSPVFGFVAAFSSNRDIFARSYGEVKEKNAVDDADRQLRNIY